MSCKLYVIKPDQESMPRELRKQRQLELLEKLVADVDLIIDEILCLEREESE